MARAVSGLDDALDRFNKSSGPGTVDEDTRDEGKGKKSATGGGHAFHIHKHTDGSHHLTVHGKHGQLIHHSEHGSMEEAAEAMKAHAAGGGGEMGGAGAGTVED